MEETKDGSTWHLFLFVVWDMLNACYHGAGSIRPTLMISKNENEYVILKREQILHMLCLSLCICIVTVGLNIKRMWVSAVTLYCV